MNLLFRLFYTLFMGRFRTPLKMTDACSTPFRVWFTDLDPLFHVNNGKYFSLMDIARTDLMTRAGTLKILSKKGIYPVVASESIKFKKSLKLFQSFEIRTQVLGWDERNFYLKQDFEVEKQKVTTALVKAQFLKRSGGKVTPLELLKILNLESVEMDLPSYILDWSSSIEKSFSH